MRSRTGVITKRKKRKKNMRLIGVLSLAVCLLFTSQLILPANGDSVAPNAPDIVEATCDQCAQKFFTTYTYCLNSLQEPSISHLVNLPGLGIVTMELVLENATSTSDAIKDMLDNRGLDPFIEDCLMVCLDLYQSAMQAVEEAVNDFLLDRLDLAEKYMNSVMHNAVVCEDGFQPRKGEVTPLSEQNKNLHDLSSIALCIIKLVASNMPPNLSSTAEPDHTMRARN